MLAGTDIADGETLGVAQRSALFGRPGGDRSPQLEWSGHPAGTRSFAVTCYDPDALTVSGFWHRAVYDIPSSVRACPPGRVTRAAETSPPGRDARRRHGATLLPRCRAGPGRRRPPLRLRRPRPGPGRGVDAGLRDPGLTTAIASTGRRRMSGDVTDGSAAGGPCAASRWLITTRPRPHDPSKGRPHTRKACSVKQVEH
ncbi:YbhB/YbcL family Raf kinase inhibitor-like protein [Actinacidiphila glaucinigra]|uniref:YbhB/YbcL family Raf kinase inhibitor-like protein n=1 Tax=Actinacidiphila glaucinigra TaxID=235986 RepID=UPI003862DB88